MSNGLPFIQNRVLNTIAKTLWKQRLAVIFAILSAWYVLALPSSLFNDPCSTVLEDANGELLGAKIAPDGQWRFPSSGKIPDKFAKALVTFEDKRFYSHPGYDMLATGRAMRRNLKSGRVEEGGSTISMQLIRLMRKGKDRTIGEKLVELVLASRLEFRYTKDEILALYASNAPFGGNVVGVEAAAWRYFGRPADELSWGEAATLAVLPNSPSIIHPGRNRDQLLLKRNKLLDKLKAQDYLSAEDAELAKYEALPMQPLPLPMVAPHLLDKATLTRQGQLVKSTVNYQLQERVSRVLNRYVTDFRSNKINNAAAIVVEVKTGKVIAYVGNAAAASNNDKGSSVDIIPAARSTGSILKPFLFAAMVDEGLILPTTLVPDYPLHIAGFSPNNYNKTFDGAVPAKSALSRSLNVPSVRMLQNYSVEKFHRLLKQLGMTTLTKPSGHYGLSLILGGAEGSLWDITGMYVYMARTLNTFSTTDGHYNPDDLRSLYVFSDSEKKKNNRLEDRGLINASACWQTVEALSEVHRPEEEATWESFSSSRKVAWKTGTSYGNRDAWAIGVTPTYAVGVWVGNADGEGRSLLTGVGYAAPLMFDIWGLLPKSSEWFSRPYDDMQKIAVCHKSGYPASDLCEQVDSVWVGVKGSEMSVCPYHILVHLDEQEHYRVNSSCYPVSCMVNKPWFVLPPAQEWYYKMGHPDYQVLPPFRTDCLGSDSDHPIGIIYPVANTEIVIARQMDGSEGKAIFQAVHRNKNAVIFWHIDDEYVGTTVGDHRLPLAPKAGTHRLRLVDEEGNTIGLRFYVRDKEES